MEDCANPLYDMIFVITEHSEDLYDTVSNLKNLSKDESDDDDGEMITPISEVNNHCWCSDGDQ